ncbi:MAG: large conductance mechanosensitive channel protein MscL [Clostridiales bacterium]|nr:MAG: large conductance mechanosensitive channel protein MscL [Clostridiales bacterium]
MKKLFGEFKAFISRGNVLDMAVGVIIGSAFTAIVNSLVNDIFMPLLGVLTGGLDFSSLTIKLASDEAIQAAIDAGKTPAMLKYGSFIAAIINFLLIALVIFAVTKTISALRERAKKNETQEEEKEKRLCPYCRSEIAEDATRCPHCTSMLELPQQEETVQSE